MGVVSTSEAVADHSHFCRLLIKELYLESAFESAVQARANRGARALQCEESIYNGGLKAAYNVVRYHAGGSCIDTA